MSSLSVLYLGLVAQVVGDWFGGLDLVQGNSEEVRRVSEAAHGGQICPATHLESLAEAPLPLTFWIALPGFPALSAGVFGGLGWEDDQASHPVAFLDPVI